VLHISIVNKSSTTRELGLIQIGTHLSFTLTSELMRQLGFVAKGKDCTAVIYSQLDFSKICTFLIHHIGQVQRQIRGNHLNY